jgi:hypothetical protein
VDLLKAADELKAIAHQSQILIDAWREDPDNYSLLTQNLTELAFELDRIAEDKE